MWKIFEHKNNKEESVKSNEVKPESLALEKKEELIDSEPIDIRLNVLTDYFKQCQEQGITITPEMAQKEISENLGIEASELLNKYLNDPEIIKVHRDIAAEVEEMMTQKASDEKTALSYLREKIFKSNFAKAAFVTTILLLKFNASHASDNQDNVKVKDQKKVEFQKSVTPEGGGDQDKNYDSTHDFNQEKKISIQAGSYFETDKANLNNEADLAHQFDNFFSSINDGNFDKVMSHDWVFASSSDERQTSNWGGSNKNLSDARFESFLKLFNEVRANHDFKGVSPDHVKQILDKPIENVQPLGGETHITDLINPETGQKFTKQEVSSLNNDAREQLLEKCRYANFEAESSMFKIGNSDELILLVDNSPSMKTSKVNMANELKYINKDLPVKVGFFSSELDDIKEVSSSQEAALEVMKAPSEGSGSERALSSAINYLEHISPDDTLNKTIYVATDEGLQDLSKVLQLTDLAKQTNTQVTFLMFYENGSKFIKMGANDLLNEFKKNVETNILTHQETLSKNIVHYEQQIDDLVEKITNKLHDSSFETGKMFDALAADGIKGKIEDIKQALLEADFQDLKNIESSYLGGKLVQAKQNLVFNKIILEDAKLPLDQQLVESNSFTDRLKINEMNKITTFEDSKGGKVEIPIIN